MKKTVVLIILAIVLFYNYEKIDEVIFQMNLSKNRLNYDETYFFDLNGDGKSEEIKLKSYKDKKNNFIVDLYINKKLKEKYKYENNIRAHIYDFNKINFFLKYEIVLNKNKMRHVYNGQLSYGGCSSKVFKDRYLKSRCHLREINTYSAYKDELYC